MSPEGDFKDSITRKRWLRGFSVQFPRSTVAVYKGETPFKNQKFGAVSKMSRYVVPKGLAQFPTYLCAVYQRVWSSFQDV